MRLRLVHTADLHLGSPFVDVEETDSRIAGELRESMFRAFESTIDLCITEKVDALVVAGDVFDGESRSETAQERFVTELHRLHDAGIQSFVCHGNHDPLEAWSQELVFPASCHRFGETFEEVPLDPREPEKGTVAGISYPSSNVSENLAERFPPRTSSGFRIGLLHCNVANDPAHASYSPCGVNDLERKEIDYWALGHIHNRRILSKRSPSIVYPGIPQGRHPGEPGARGVSLVTVEDDGRVEISFRAIDRIRWGRSALDISSIRSMPALVDCIKNSLEKELREADGRSLIYSVKLTGASPLDATLSDPRASAELTRSVNATLAHDEPWAWCRGIRISSRT